jgi:hypothetical protein
LDEVIRDKKTGWPAFRYGKTPSLQAENPVPTAKQQPVPYFSDNFSSHQLQREWAWDVSKPKPVTSFSDNKLLLQANETPIGSFLGLQVKKPNYTFVVNLHENKNVSTGICIYGTYENGIGLSVENGNIELWQVKSGARTVLITKPAGTFPISLCLKTQFGQYCRFGTMEQNRFQAIGQPIHLNELPQWDRPAMVGIQARGKAAGIFYEVLLSWE